MKEIQTNNITILFVEVPSVNLIFDIHDNYLVMGTNAMDVSSKKRKIRNGDNKGFINLNKVDWQILGKSTELSEEQMKEICPKCIGLSVYPDYNFKPTRLVALKFFHTVQESYISLLEANGIDNNKIHLILKMI